jgi:hypothetical protein
MAMMEQERGAGARGLPGISRTSGLESFGRAVSPVLTWGLRFAAAAGLGLALPALPAPVVPVHRAVRGLFAAWALAANDAKRDEKNENLRELPVLPAAARRRARPRRVQTAGA